MAVAGEISAGKSSRVNALVASNVAETDVIPTTDRPKTYPADFNGVASVLVDMHGLDGSTRVTDTVLAELQRADLVIWTIRANRPAREVGRASIAQFYQFFEDQL
ncbi:GTPase [uncultured Sulfitobacter sp.]|uniref:GTPase n=1 Tax=uncultured Sulfitobacter sp. TaxID=191468 RepID=UPI0030D7AC73